MIWLLIIYLISIYFTRWGIQKRLYQHPQLKVDISDLMIVLTPIVNTGFGIIFILLHLLNKYHARTTSLVEEFF